LDPGFGGGRTALDGDVSALCVFDDGSGPALYAGGSFTYAGGVQANYVAKWNGTTWAALGHGVTGSPAFNLPPSVSALAVFDDGSGPALYVGGRFTTASGVPALNIARWNGSSWAAVPGSGAEIPGCMSVHTLAVLHTGSANTLYVGIQGYCMTYSSAEALAWDGATWSSPGYLSGAHVDVTSMAVLDDGSGPALYVGGNFTSPVNHIGKWDGSSWSTLGSGIPGEFNWVNCVAAWDSGAGTEIYAGGNFTSAGGVSVNNIAKWNGSSWSSVGTGTDGAVYSLLVFDDGSGPALYAAGAFTQAGGTAAFAHVARWNGTSWSALDGSLDSGVFALASFDDGKDASADLYAGGDFQSNGSQQLDHIAEWHGCSTMAFCFGDAGAAVCPCANNGNVGHGCDNSAATGGAALSASGTIVPDTLKLTQTGELASSLSIFLQGDTSIAPTFFGDGLRCAGGTLKRLFVKNAASGVAIAPGPGDPSVSAQSAALGDPIAPGTTRYYQVYYRDPDLTFCPPPAGNSFNVGNGMQVKW
jgi:hypothetical protein